MREEGEMKRVQKKRNRQNVAENVLECSPQSPTGYDIIRERTGGVVENEREKEGGRDRERKGGEDRERERKRRGGIK